jgi:hypothetical protein
MNKWGNIYEIDDTHKLDGVHPGFDRIPTDPDISDILEGLDVLFVFQIYRQSRMTKKCRWPEFRDSFDELTPLIVNRIHSFYLSQFYREKKMSVSILSLFSFLRQRKLRK